MNSSVDIVELVTNQPILSSDPLNKKTLLIQSSIQSALTLECIWNLRNQVEHKVVKIGILRRIAGGTSWIGS